METIKYINVINIVFLCCLFSQSCTSEQKDCLYDAEMYSGSCVLKSYMDGRVLYYSEGGNIAGQESAQRAADVFLLECLDYLEKKEACAEKSSIIPAFSQR